jgi:hypothetical protein
MKTNIVLYILLALSFSACAKHRAVPMDIQCDEYIKTANNYLLNNGENFDKATRNKITNLIQAAKIQQQHGEFANCIDKAERALSLLDTEQR